MEQHCRLEERIQGVAKSMNKKVYHAVKSGQSDSNIGYNDFQNLILALGFEKRRQKGSHTMYYHKPTREFMNIQKDGGKAKSYQVEQLRTIIKKHDL
jgi:predicted RNA binding protein YcfA (HicA-like mRNA interferase family)